MTFNFERSTALLIERIAGAKEKIADTIIILAAGSLPWSTSAFAILMGLWLISFIPTVQYSSLLQSLWSEASALPLLLFLLAILGTFWSPALPGERLAALSPLLKLLFIPFLIYHFQRSVNAPVLLRVFVGSCTLLLITSWVLFLFPMALPLRVAGVPVKNYIDQNQEFGLCVFILSGAAFYFHHYQRAIITISQLFLALSFLANMAFVALARTALVYMPVIFLIMIGRFLDWQRAMLAGLIMLIAGVLFVAESPYLHLRVYSIISEYRQYQQEQSFSSSSHRLEYWLRSTQFIRAAPILGHGTGSLPMLFNDRSAAQPGEISSLSGNPHNQTFLIAIQWGFIGIVLLYSMWAVHLRLFSAKTFVAWIGFVLVLQNVISSIFNSHLSDFLEGWIYVLGVGVAGGYIKGHSGYSNFPEEGATKA